MNDTELHTRLAALADDLAPDADPHAQVAGARSLHRRRRRTRLGVAGAALAVALVAVGVPTAVGTLSAPLDGEVAGPSESRPESLRGPAHMVRSALDGWDGSVPDPAVGRSCSTSADVLDIRGSLELVRQPSGSTNTACLWSSDGTGGTREEQRIDAELAANDFDADRLQGYLEDRGCEWTTLFPDRTPNVLQLCEDGGRWVWTLLVLDEDGAGGWTATAAVGEDVSAGFTLGARSVGALWGVVSEFAPEPRPEEDREEVAGRLEQVRLQTLDALALRPEPRLQAGSEEPACRDVAGELSAAFGPGLTPVTDRAADGIVDCTWISESSGAPVTASVRFLADVVGGGKLEDVTVGSVVDSDARGTADASRDCVPTTVTAAGGARSSLVVCGLSGRTQAALGVEDAAGAGVWVLSADVSPGSRLGAADALLRLLGAAEGAW